MATAYLDPNLNQALVGGAKPGVGQAGGVSERLLKVFHHFESNSEHDSWASNIRHGEATDIRVSAHTHARRCTHTSAEQHAHTYTHRHAYTCPGTCIHMQMYTHIPSQSLTVSLEEEWNMRMT